MNAGELQKVIKEFNDSLPRRIAVTLSLIGVGSLIIFFQILSEKKMLSLPSLFGVVLIFLGFIEVETLRKGVGYRHTLKEYEKAWLLVRWTRENLQKKIGLLITENRDMTRYAFNLVSEGGVGPYPPHVLFSVIHSAKIYDAERSLTIGMIDLLGSNHLVGVPSGYTWSEDIRAKFLELNPVYHEFDPDNPRTYSYGAFHHGNMD